MMNPLNLLQESADSDLLQESADSRWYRIDIRTSHCAADLVTQLLVALGSKGSAIQSNGEWSIVSGYLPFDGRGSEWLSEATSRLEVAKSYGLCRPDSSVAIAAIAHEDWAENWKQFFEPIEVARRFRIVPPWLSPEDRESKIEDRNDTAPLQSSILDPRSSIVIESGMAFGTGQHATTVLCLEMLEEVVREGDVVLDVGTGSGILAIAAAKLGASRVIAIDSDPVCPPAAVKNCAMNNVADRVTIINGDLLTCIRGRFDVVVANLTSFGIVSLCAHVHNHLQVGGTFIASGIPADRADEVREAVHSAIQNQKSKIKNRDGWVALATRFCPE